ncbi:MAG TPA: FAD:protein FMN transferase [Gemmataceae bacterium]|nr:FAD:protein FMN transferase [Gemmataceae bacterium]
MDRRDFLDPRQLAHTAAQVLGAVEELHARPATCAEAEVALLRLAHRAMATTFEVVLPYGTPNALAAGSTTFAEIDRLEQQLTVYRETSEVSRLNRLAARTAVPVEPELFNLLSLAAHIHAETAGGYDVTAGALIKAWGFYRGPRRVPSDEERAAALGRVGMQHVLLDSQAHTVRFLRSGLEINFGSIGKGYALDRVAQRLRSDCGVTTALVHGGHSSVYAMGQGPAGQRGWSVGIRHPWQPDTRLALVWLRDCALGTSAATSQHLEYNGRKLGHILDPRSGWPAEELASVSVIAPSAAEADALSTAFFVLGRERTRAYCETHPHVGALLLPQGESARPVAFGLNEEQVLIFD